jgi:membrane protease YdiL (CAAX protease family)
MKHRIILDAAIAAIVAILGVLAFLYNGFTEFFAKEFNATIFASSVLSLAPIIFLLIFCGVSDFFKQLFQPFNKSPLKHQYITIGCISAGITLCWTISTILNHNFEPFACLVIGFLCVGGLCSAVIQFDDLAIETNPHNVYQSFITTSLFNWFDALIWIFLFVPLDYNWFQIGFWRGIDTTDNSISYGWWAMTVTTLAVIRYGFIKKLKGFNFTLIPRPKDVLFMSLGTMLILVLFSPWIFAFGLFEIKKHVKIQVLAPLTYALENFLTTAITDEVFFRGLLQNGIYQRLTYFISEKRDTMKKISESLQFNEPEDVPIAPSITTALLGNTESQAEYLLTKKEIWRNRIISLAVASFLFGLMHWPRYDQLEQQLILVAAETVVGIIIGLCYIFSENRLFSCVVIHCVTDTLRAFLLKPLH